MMVSEEAGTVQEDVTSTEEGTHSENQGKVNSEETKSGRPSALGGAAALATATIIAAAWNWLADLIVLQWRRRNCWLPRLLLLLL